MSISSTTHLYHGGSSQSGHGCQFVTLSFGLNKLHSSSRLLEGYFVIFRVAEGITNWAIDTKGIFLVFPASQNKTNPSINASMKDLFFSFYFFQPGRKTKMIELHSPSGMNGSEARQSCRYQRCIPAGSRRRKENRTGEAHNTSTPRNNSNDSRLTWSSFRKRGHQYRHTRFASALMLTKSELRLRSEGAPSVL